MDELHSLALVAPPISRSWSADYSRVQAYYELTKPGITLFIGITAACGLIAAQPSAVSSSLLAVTVAATMLLSGGAAAQNQLAERAFDARMQRTARRPLPAGKLSVRQARWLAWSLTAAGTLLSILALPIAATLLLIFCHISYVHIYTPLKRRTPLCTLAGAVPGALPVLAGWAATGRPVGVAALALTGLLFMWQIPHFMAIGWLAREDYTRAGYRMLFVIDASGRQAAIVSMLYAAGMLGCALLLALAAPVGWLYPPVAVTCSAAYVLRARQLILHRDRERARRLFFTSLFVLPLILAALSFDLLFIG